MKKRIALHLAVLATAAVVFTVTAIARLTGGGQESRTAEMVADR